MQQPTILNKPKLWLFGSAGLLIGASAFLAVPPSGRTDPPQLSVSLTPTNTLLLTVVNGTNNEYYEIYRKAQLEDPVWSGSITGGLGNLTFLVPIYPNESMGFFKARSGNNWDGDSSPNYRDADPNDPAVGDLTVTIDSPAQGQIFQ